MKPVWAAHAQNIWLIVQVSHMSSIITESASRTTDPDYLFSQYENGDLKSLYIAQKFAHKGMDVSLDLAMDEQGFKSLRSFSKSGDNMDITTDDGLQLSTCSRYVDNEFNLTIGVEGGSAVTIYLPLTLKRAICLQLHEIAQNGLKELACSVEKQ